jgi:hypothetical protein
MAGTYGANFAGEDNLGVDGEYLGIVESRRDVACGLLLQ